jgi:hypothetical protein
MMLESTIYILIARNKLQGISKCVAVQTPDSGIVGIIQDKLLSANIELSVTLCA